MKSTIFSEYSPKHKKAVCIDSDGCVFDTMEIKHKECFCPSMIKFFGMQPISKYARDAWEFANLYSKDRGRSRFIDLVKTIELLKDRDEVKAYNYEFPDISILKEWTMNSSELNNERLTEYNDEIMKTTLAWSLDCNERIADMVKGIPPFPGARESIEALAEYADIVIVSATSKEALEREWGEHDLLPYIRLMCAQEDGSKSECLKMLKEHYGSENILMIGDAPGDKEAAHRNEILFYPIRPGEEISSWKEFRSEMLIKYLQGEYDKDVEKIQIERFEKCLPEEPWWKK